jgi:hypothetical protein
MILRINNIIAVYGMNWFARIIVTDCVSVWTKKIVYIIYINSAFRMFIK